jgi:hypothetical protein
MSITSSRNQIIPLAATNSIIYRFDRLIKKYIDLDIPTSRPEITLSEEEIQVTLDHLSNISREFFDKIRCWNGVYMITVLFIFVLVGVLTLKIDTKTSKGLIYGVIYTLLFVIILCGSAFVNKLILKFRNIAKEKAYQVIRPANQDLQLRGYQWYLPMTYPLWVELRKDEPPQMGIVHQIPEIHTVSLEQSTNLPFLNNPVYNYNALSYQSQQYGEGYPLTYCNQP